MLKRTRLFTLLFIIVASTLVGLLGPSSMTYAANGISYSDGCDGEPKNCTITLSSDSDIHVAYGDDTSAMEFTYNANFAKVPELQAATGIPADAVVFLDTTIPSTQTKAANDSGWSRVVYVFYYNNINDYNSKTNGYFLPVYMGKYNENFQAVPNTFAKKAEPTLVTDSNAGGVVDNEEEEAQTPEDPVVGDNEGGDEEAESTCKIDGIGWIVCPVVTFAGKVVDGSYKLLDENLLRTKPVSLENSPDNGLYNSWKVMRDFANVAFVIAFLFIVLSQLTNLGITNYGIKRALPRLVIAAILVNISFYLCAVAVDISNILGSSLKDLLDESVGQMISEYQPTYNAPSADPEGEPFSAIGWTGMAAAILGGSLLAVGALAFEVYLGLSIFIPLLFAALTAVMTVVLVLTLRQVFIILLIVLSPLAFVALLLPNTEEYFTKWRKLFAVMLLMYPVIAVIFGASSLASQIIMESSDEWTVQLMGAGASIIPLFITPIVMKAAGGVLNRFAGIVNNPNKGLIDRARNASDAKREDVMKVRDSRALNDSGWAPGALRIRRGARQKAIRSQHDRNLNLASAGYVADASLDKDVSLVQQGIATATGGRLGGNSKGDQMINQMAQGGGEAAKTAALSQALVTQSQLVDEEVKNSLNTIKELGLNQSQRRDLAQGGQVTARDGTVLNAATNSSLQKAGMQSVIDKGDFEGMNMVNDNLRTQTGEKADDLRRSFADALEGSKNRPGWYGMGALENIRQSNGSTTQSAQSEELVENSIKNNTYAPARIATTDQDELKIVADVNVRSARLTLPEKQKLVDNAATALTDPELRRTLNKNEHRVQEISTFSAPRP